MVRTRSVCAMVRTRVRTRVPGTALCVDAYVLGSVCIGPGAFCKAVVRTMVRTSGRRPGEHKRSASGAHNGAHKGAHKALRVKGIDASHYIIMLFSTMSVARCVKLHPCIETLNSRNS